MKHVLFSLLLIPFLAGSAWGFDGTLHLMLDNDFIVRTDDDYTSGLGLGWVSAPADNWQDVEGFTWLADFNERLPLVNSRRGRTSGVTVDLVHLMYTPDNIKVAEPDPNDRPYAGVIFLGLGAHQLDEKRADEWEFIFGHVGPDTGVDDFQAWVHDVIGANEPQGWEHQVGNEMLVNLSYDRRWRLLQTPLARQTWGSDLIAGNLIMLGNMRTSLVADLTWRVGYALPYGFGRTSTRLATEGYQAPCEAEPTWGGHASLGLAGEAVLHDVTLDGRLFAEDNIQISREPFIFRLISSANFHYQRLYLGFQFITASPTFKESSHYHHYARFSIGWRFY
ncbi:MAG: lipid A deacylase LpxR family protein [Thermodesulfobacteriota bacterium]